MNHVRYLSVIMIIIVSIQISESLCVNDTQFSNFSTSYKCGSTEITYPFYGGSNRPEYCSYPGFKAACASKSILTVNISSRTYRVLAMDNSSEMLTVARDDYWTKYLYNTTLDFNLFSYGLNYQNLTLYYICPATIMATTTQFTCTTIQTSATTAATGYYFTSGDESTIGSMVAGCSDLVLVSVSNTGANTLTTSPTVSNLQTVINEGFGLVWKASNSRCNVCAGSGGQEAVGSGDFACSCSDKPYGSECGSLSTGPGPSSIPVKLILAFTVPVGVIIVGFLILMVFMKKSGHNHSLDEFIRNYGSLAPKQYSYIDVKQITNSFANKLGQGGYGRVYKGKLSDGRPVAVKILNESKGHIEGFLDEVASISRTSTNYIFSFWDQLNLDIHLSIFQLQPSQKLPTSKMYWVSPFSSLLFIAFFFSLTSNIHSSSSNENGLMYQTCDMLLSCGKIRDVDYPLWVEDPFWAADRTYKCGHPEFKLDCIEEGVAIIEIENVGYRVLEINKTTHILRVARHDFDNGTCTSNFVSTTINQTLFEYTHGYTNITILYGCPPFSVAGYNLPLCYTNVTVDVVIGTRGPGSCNKSVTVSVPDARMELLKRTNFSGLGNVIRDDGFEVKWKVDRKCDECRRTGGRCGYDSLLSQTTCTRSTPARLSSIPARLILAFAAVILVGSMMFCCYRRVSTGSFFTRKSDRDHDLDEFIRNYGSFAPKQYNYSDVKKITNSFANKLGQGGYGCVYKGKLPDGRPVAVKILSESKGNGKEFLNEVASISRTSHVNVVSLLGFCYKGTKRALIYEFMPNISLDKFLYKGKSSSNTNLELDRAALFKIAIGIARGLEYLHNGCNTRILHLDIKPHNILLDQDWCPKISDFGLAKLCQRKESVIPTTGARGTIGYIAPEVFNRGFGRVSYKSDVYSYGMMILEMAGVGKEAEPEVLTETSEMYFPDWIYKRLEAGSESVPLRDDGIMGDEKNKEMERKMIIVGLWCIQTKPADRPSITGVIEMLEGSNDLQQAPPKPILFPPTSRSSRHYSSSSLSSSISQCIDIQS